MLGSRFYDFPFKMALQGFSEAFCPDLASSVTDQSCQVTLAGCGCPLPYIIMVNGHSVGGMQKRWVDAEVAVIYYGDPALSTFSDPIKVTV